MAEITTLARPYAEAVFRCAKESKDYARWSEQLAWLAAVTEQPEMRAWMTNPRLNRIDQGKLVLEVCDGRLDKEGQSLVVLLAENHRLTLLSAIASSYEALRRAEEQVLDAQITSAYPLGDDERKGIVTALEKRFSKAVQATVDVDASLLGGVRIKLGDVVIDQSVKARLENMAIALKN